MLVQCSRDSCEREALSQGVGLCWPHYQQQRRATRPDVREKDRASSRRRRKEVQADPELHAKRLAWEAEYRKKNQDILRPRMARHQRNRRLGGKDPETILYLDVISKDPCAYCGAPSESTDHIDPISKGGLNHWTNYTPACKSCNSAKHDKSLLLYLHQKAA